MANRYTQTVNSSQTRFTQAPMGVLEFSTMYGNPKHTTDFDGGDIVPIFCEEILPNSTFEMGLDFVIRQATVAVPTMDQLNADFYAFFVPNRVVNRSWKNVMGENSSGAWSQNEDIVLAPLYKDFNPRGTTQIPICSVADYYGLPTQEPIPNALFAQMHDLKFRGYLEIYNHYFRDQNYQPPIPYSKLNVYNAFLEAVPVVGNDAPNIGGYEVDYGQGATGQYGAGAIQKELFGEGSINDDALYQSPLGFSSWSALSKPLKANKLHDYFTSCLPSPQKTREVVVPIFGNVTLNTSDTIHGFTNGDLTVRLSSGMQSNGGTLGVYGSVGNTTGTVASFDSAQSGTPHMITGTNLVGNLESYNLSVSDLRMSSAIQQVYEVLGRGGSRYVEYIKSFFGLDVDNPFDDIPTYLGHFSRELDLFQTAQTSATPSASEGAGTAQGNLAAFGYTAKGGNLFTKTFNEHGYIHIFAVVRHKNVYPSFVGRDNFRRSMMDFYQYPLANISEQPVYTREINPFLEDTSNVFGYQEAWAEYRMSPDRVSGHMRPGVPLTLANWNYADPHDPSLLNSNGDWLLSNTADVVRRSTAIQDQELPQFKGEFIFHIKKRLPMPTYSVAGLDII